MVDDRNVRVDKASPSFAVEVLGLGDVPAAGDEFEVYLDEKVARAIADQRTMDQRQARLVQAMASRRVTLGTLSEKVKEGDLKELNIILKADVKALSKQFWAHLPSFHKEKFNSAFSSRLLVKLLKTTSVWRRQARQLY